MIFLIFLPYNRFKHGKNGYHCEDLEKSFSDWGDTSSNFSNLKVIHVLVHEMKIDNRYSKPRAKIKRKKNPQNWEEKPKNEEKSFLE